MTTHAPPSINIVDVMLHPALFAPFFGPSWAAWCAFLAALFGLPMTQEQAEVYRRCTGRRTLPTEPFGEAALIIGRRGGKSRALSLIAVFLACFRDYSPFLAPGEVPTIAVIAADRRQARVVTRYIAGLLHAVPALAALIEGETAENVTLTNGVAIEVHTASFRVTRGYTFAAVLADECAFWPVDDAAEPDTEILRAVRPGLLSLPGAMLLLASSPYAKRGELWNAFKRHYGHDDAKVLVWRGSTETMNPTADKAAIAEAREADPQAAAAEYDAQFRDDVAGFLTPELIAMAVEPGRIVRPPIDGVRYVAFADPSGGTSDSFTAAVAHMDGNTAVLDCIFERRPPFNPQAVVADVVALLQSYGLSIATGDRYAAQWVVEAFRQAGAEYVHSTRDRSAIYLDALPLFTSGRVALLDVPRLAAQFASLERRTGAGRDRVDHSPGGHDDLCNSAAGALVLAVLGEGVASGWMQYFREHTPESRAAAAAAARNRELQQTEQKPLQRGDTAPRFALPDGVPGADEVRLVAPAPWACFFASAPDGHGQKFTADADAIVTTPAAFAKSLVAAGCRIAAAPTVETLVSAAPSTARKAPDGQDDAELPRRREAASNAQEAVA
jgi:hypothetical protein